jgi:hypothetical protein
MGVAEKIAALAARLPPAKQAEVLDFVEFLAARSAEPTNAASALDDEGFRALALRALADEDDPVVYVLADCRETR